MRERRPRHFFITLFGSPIGNAWGIVQERGKIHRGTLNCLLVQLRIRKEIFDIIRGSRQPRRFGFPNESPGCIFQNPETVNSSVGNLVIIFKDAVSDEFQRK